MLAGQESEKSVKTAATTTTSGDGADNPRPTVRVGVLFVHGIGMQKQGETLTAAGEPLYRWFRDWFGTAAYLKPAAEVSLERTVLFPSSSEPDAPPHSWLCIRRQHGGADVELLLAESHWADSFPVPHFSDVARWALLVLPWTIATQFLTRLRRVLAVYPHRLRYYPLIVVEALAYLGGFLLSALVELLVLALLLVAVVPIPRFRDFIVGLQLKIASVIGDSYVLLRSPMREDAIVNRVVRDIAWLDGRGCGRIGLVAHSQGGAIAHRVVRAAPGRALRPVKLLFTFGSGLGKLHDIKANSDSPNLLWVGWWALVFIVVATLLTPANVYLMLTDAQALREQPLSVAFAGVLAPMLAILVLLLLQVWMRTGRDGLVPVSRGAVKPLWVDRHASQDPVPAGPLLDAPHDDIDTAPVFNRHALWSDHTTYWQNEDGFVTEVARRLADLADLPLAGPAADAVDAVDASLAAAAPRRRWRVWWLVALRVLIGANAALIAWVLHRQRALTALGGEVTAALGRLSATAGRYVAGAAPPGTATAAVESTTDPLWQRLWDCHGDLAAGLAAIALLHLLWYRLGYRVWRWWSRRDLEALHSCRRRDAGGAPFGVLAAVALALPVLSVLLFYGGSAAMVDAFVAVAAWPRAVHLGATGAVAASLVAGALLGTWGWWKSDEVLWTAGLPAGLFGFAVTLALALPSALWVGFWHPGWFDVEPGDWSAAGFGILLRLALFVVPSLLAWLWLLKIWRPLLRLGRSPGHGWRHPVRWLYQLPARARDWVAAKSVQGPLRSHPMVSEHPIGVRLAISGTAGVLALAASLGLQHGWLGAWGVAAYAATALVAALMAWSLRQRLAKGSALYRLAGVLLWLPYWALSLGMIEPWLPFGG